MSSFLLGALLCCCVSVGGFHRGHVSQDSSGKGRFDMRFQSSNCVFNLPSFVSFICFIRIVSCSMNLHSFDDDSLADARTWFISRQQGCPPVTGNCSGSLVGEYLFMDRTVILFHPSKIQIHKIYFYYYITPSLQSNWSTFHESTFFWWRQPGWRTNVIYITATRLPAGNR
jgi:hypothetical protein